MRPMLEGIYFWFTNIWKYISGHTTELFVSGILLVCLRSFIKWIIKKVREYIRIKRQQKAIKEELVKFSQDQLQKQINSKKYLPASYIEVNQVKECLRYFCYPFLFCNKFIDHINRRDFTYTNSVLKREIKQRVIFKKFRKLSKPSLKALKNKITELHKAIDQNLKVLKDMPENSNSFPWQARWKMEETIEKFDSLKSRVLVLLDDAGQGKTNLICDLTKEFLLKLGIPVVLFYGSDFYGLTSNSMKTIVTERITGVPDFNILDKFIDDTCLQNKVNFIIIIDALNESSDPNFPNALDAFIREMLSNEFVRIILTCRTEYYNLNFKKVETSSFHADINKIIGINSKLEEHEKDNLFRKYLDFFKINWNLFSGRVYEKLVSNFLLLRIFCEVYQGQSIGSILNVYMLDLFQQYYRQVRDGIKGRVTGNSSIEKVVCEVVAHMIDARLFKDVPMQKVIDRAAIDKNALLKLIDENIFFRRDIADKSGVLLDAEVISFTFDEIRDYLIADYLVNILLPSDATKAEKFISEEISPEKPLFEGVSKYLYFFSKKDRKNTRLSLILESSKWYKDKNIYYLFETNEADITSKDIEEVKAAYLSDGDKAEFILKMLVYHHYDPSTYKNLNITMLFPILIEMPDKERIDKFDRHFREESSSIAYGGRQNILDIDHYFQFIADAIEKGDKNNPTIDFLFFIISCSGNYNLHTKAKGILTLIYKKYPEITLRMLDNYKNCTNDSLKVKAIALIKEFNG